MQRRVNLEGVAAAPLGWCLISISRRCSALNLASRIGVTFNNTRLHLYYTRLDKAWAINFSQSYYQPSDAEVKQLVDDTEKFALANHIFWGLWGLISAYVNHIDFDYMEYARQRFQQYWLRKLEILNK
ncbi:Hypothetical predicted protein [Olea europaea subsp. europaea]|uniref:Uncharacterized protein n=1 Tax=Olea europaea subsp. europaea TaxID=158383 RepID=A0A8S0PAQ1_OLEEU|nr:Hypothetical predicted protein [Olea europaea subsp. europaea]